jgi:hypothetical protein
MKQLGRSLIALAVLAVMTAGSAVLADTVMINPGKDNTLYENGGGLLSNGAGNWIFTGRTATGSIRRALLQFDVAGSIPAGATINSVTLQLNMDMSIVGAVNNNLHRATADWGEGASDAGGQEGTGIQAEPGDATWLHTFYDSSFWGSAGGDFAGASSASASVSGPGAYTWGSTPQMVADVQAWLDSPGGNFGWIVIGNEGSFPTAKRFSAREGASPPTLTVDFTPDDGGPDPTGVPTVGEWGLILMSLLLLTAGSLVFGGRAATVGGRGTVPMAGGQPLFVPQMFLKALAVTLALIAVGFVTSIVLLGQLSGVDVAGSLLCAPIFAYLIHLWAAPRK